MSLKIKITKDSYNGLDEAIKALYIEDGEDYKLDADYEDVSGLKSKRDELLAENKRLKSKQLPDGLTAEQIQEAITFKQTAEEKESLARGEFEAVRKKIEEKAANEKAELSSQLTALRQSVAEKDLTVALAASGVMADKAARMAKLLQIEDIKPVFSEDGSTVWRSLDDTQTIELEKYIPTVKDSYAEFFSATNHSGGGAVGNQNNGSAKTISRDSFNGLTPIAQKQFFEEGGTLTD